MFVDSVPTQIALVAAALLAFGLVACEEVSSPVESSEVAFNHGASGNTPAALNRQIAELRSETAQFHRFERAQAAGHNVLVAHPQTGAECLEHETLGGMGYHFLNLDLVDEEVSVTAPEVVIYEPRPNGELRMVGFEYIIPFAILSEESDPPVLFGQEFKRNHTFGLWALHVWAWKNNPTGMFADWNPKVSCEYADKVAL